MKIVWGHGSATVRDVYEELLTRRKIAYTTVMTALKTLEQKGYLRTNQKDRAFVYEPTRPKNQVIRAMVRDFVERVFGGSARTLLVQLLEEEPLSEAELREIARMAGRKR